MTASTATAWLSVLEASHQVSLLEPWFSNRNKSLIKTPKLHLRDSGLAAFLVGVRSPDELSRSPMAGALWETAVFGEIRRAQTRRSGGWELNFWRDRSREADFLRHRGGRFMLLDAKWSEHPTSKDARALTGIAVVGGATTAPLRGDDFRDAADRPRLPTRHSLLGSPS